jgi:hypothetical protein
MRAAMTQFTDMDAEALVRGMRPGGAVRFYDTFAS